MKPTVGSLFSGIGGLDLAAHWAGFETAWFVEKEPFCQKVLAKHWPNVPIHDDVFTCNNLPHVDVICGGFPCQPFSVAGQRKGADDERYLLPEMLRIVSEVKPYAVLFENVPGFPSLNDGAEFKYLLRALAEMGFDAEWGHLRASDVGAPHQRERWLCMAYASGAGLEGRNRSEPALGEYTRYPEASLGNPELSGFNRFAWGRAGAQLADGYSQSRRGQTQSRICWNVDGFSTELDGYRGVGNALSEEINTRKILFTMRRKVGTKAFQRNIRGFRRFQPPKVLRKIVFAQSTQETKSDNFSLPQTSASSQTRYLPTMRNYGEFASSSQGFESSQQQPIKFDDLMRLMSYEMALGERERILTKASVSLQDLWSATSEITSSYVRKTLPALQEIWRSLPNENKVWIALRACEGSRVTTLFPACPGQPQYAYEPPRTAPSTPTTNARIKALGNAVIPQVAYPIFEAIAEWLQENDA